jgi:hypothetical protein
MRSSHRQAHHPRLIAAPLPDTAPSPPLPAAHPRQGRPRSPSCGPGPARGAPPPLPGLIQHPSPVASRHASGGYWGSPRGERARPSSDIAGAPARPFHINLSTPAALRTCLEQHHKSHSGEATMSSIRADDPVLLDQAYRGYSRSYRLPHTGQATDYLAYGGVLRQVVVHGEPPGSHEAD